MVFNAVIELAKQEIEHGNIFPYQVHFLPNGMTKLAGWHLKNSTDWQNDFLDAVAVIHSCITLDMHHDGLPFSLKKLIEMKELYDKYPGLYNFCHRIVKSSSVKGFIKLEDLKKEVSLLYRVLQRESLDISKTNS